MSQRYKMTELAGAQRMLIPTTDSNDESINSVKSPEWMVKIGVLTSSTIVGFLDYAPLYGWYGESSRITAGDIGGPLQTSAQLKHSDLVLILGNGGYATSLEASMNKGYPLDLVTIVRLGNIQGVTVKLQTTAYGNCMIQSFQQQLDRLVLHLSVTTKTNTVLVYNNLGVCAGQMVSSVDYSKNVAQ